LQIEEDTKFFGTVIDFQNGGWCILFDDGSLAANQPLGVIKTMINAYNNT
jgi:hypothetical protein